MLWQDLQLTVQLDAGRGCVDRDDRQPVQSSSHPCITAALLVFSLEPHCGSAVLHLYNRSSVLCTHADAEESAYLVPALQRTHMWYVLHYVRDQCRNVKHHVAGSFQLLEHSAVRSCCFLKTHDKLWPCCSHRGLADLGVLEHVRPHLQEDIGDVAIETSNVAG